MREIVPVVETGEMVEEGMLDEGMSPSEGYKAAVCELRDRILRTE